MFIFVFCGARDRRNSINPMTVSAVLLLSILTLLIISVLRKNERWSFYLTVALLLATGVVLLFVQIPRIDEGFAHSFGDALIIAAILSATVDVYLKERVLREVSSDVSKYLVGYRLPEEVQNRIRGLMQTRWIRRNCTARLRLTEIHDRPGFVKIEMVVSKDVENITMQEESFCDKYLYERHLPEAILEMRCDSPDLRAQYLLRGEGLAKEKADEPGVMEASGKVVRIPPVHEALGTYYRFSVKYEAEHPENYSDILSFDLPTINVIFEAECPAGFRVSAAPADVSTHNRWEYRRLFLPGEHIRFRWERIREAGNQA
ncbi:MAG TPA: hypothetical protein VLV89_00230 [Candidatus Acidoferrum sp.]|nr:hypothetical protein [Candidatus Acidoferrum sp.]